MTVSSPCIWRILLVLIGLFGKNETVTAFSGSYYVHQRPWRSSLILLQARRGAMGKTRKKKTGGFGSQQEQEEAKEEEIKEGSIYSLPALYDLAFGYRNFNAEVDFLLYAHKTHAGSGSYPKRILELAAGPARHSIAALVDRKHPVDYVLAVDISDEMVNYGTKEVADVELPVDKRPMFEYIKGDVREPIQTKEQYDSAWILLGSMQHLVTNQDVISCFQSAHDALGDGGSLIVELPHPRETFSMVECTRNGWEVPLEDDSGDSFGELKIIWGDDDDYFDPIRQVRNFTVSLQLEGVAEQEELQSVKEVVPMRMFTAQEMDALARCSGFRVAAMYGALDRDVQVNDDDDAFRLVCVLCKGS